MTWGAIYGVKKKVFSQAQVYHEVNLNNFNVVNVASYYLVYLSCYLGNYAVCKVAYSKS